MSSLDFRVSNVYPGTENQKKIGILATFTLNVVVDDEVVSAAADMKLAKNKQGAIYIASPSREFNGRDGKTARVYFFKLFPENKESNEEAQRLIIEQVKREVDAKASRSGPKGSGNSFGNKGPNKPPAKTNSSADW